MSTELVVETDAPAQQLRGAKPSAPTTLWTADAAGNVNFVNAAWIEWTGKPLEAHLNLGWTESVVKEDRHRVIETYLSCISQQQPFSLHFRFTGTDATIRWCHAFGEPYYNSAGELQGFITLCHDITDQREAQRHLDEREERMRFAIQSAGLGTWDLDPVNNVVRWDERCRELYGFEGNEIITYEELLRHIYPEDVQKVTSAVNAALDPLGAGNYDIEFRTVSSNGNRLRWLRCRGKAYFNESHTAYRFAGTALDITEDKRKDEVLNNLEQRFQVAFDHATLGIVMTDMHGRFLMVNKAFATMVGYDPEELYGNTFEMVTHEEDVEESREKVKSLARGEISRISLDKRYLTREKKVVWGNLTASLVQGSGAGGQILFGIVRDISNEITHRVQQEKLLTLVNNSVELMSILEMDGKNSYINKAGRELLGFENEDQVRHTPISELHRPEDLELVKSHILPVTLKEGHWAGEMMVKKLGTGEVFPVFNQSIRIDDPKTGQPVAIGAIMRDLRPEMEQQEALVQSEKRFRSMIEQSPVAMGVLKGEKMVIDTVNNGLLAIWGKGPNVIGYPILEALPEIQDQPFPTILKKVMDTGIPYYGYEYKTMLVRNGRLEECYFDFVYAPYIEENNITGVQVSAFDVTPQVQARKELEASEERFRNLIQQAPFATALYTGTEMRISMANEAMIRLWGKGPSIVGKTLNEGLPELEGQPFLDLLRQVYNNGVPYSAMEDPATLLVDGKLQTNYFNFTYKPLTGSDGSIYGILNMAVDVTELVLARKKVEEQETYFRRMTDTVPSMIWVTDPNGYCSYLNAKWYEYTGQKEAEALGLGWLEAVHPDDKEKSGRLFLEATRNRKTYQSLYRLKNKDNQYRWFLDIGIPRFTPEGVFEGMTGSVLDIDESKKAQEKLADAEERLRLAADGTGLATWDLDLVKGAIIYSPRLNEIFGWDRNKILTHTEMRSQVHPHDLKNIVEPAFERALQNGIYEYESRVIRPDQSIKWIRTQGKVIFSPEGKAVRMLGTMFDITESKEARLALEESEIRYRQLATELELRVKDRTQDLQRANENLERSNTELAQYAFVASHDLQEPLRKIRVFSGMLHDRKDLSGEARGTLSKIMSSAERMSLLIKDLLEFSRLLKAGRTFQKTDLNEVVRKVMTDFELSIAEKNAEVVVGNLPVIEAMSLQMNQLFYNLVSNALKFTKPGEKPVIRIQSRKLSPDEIKSNLLLPSECYHAIEVKDNGIGFAAHFSEQIFEIFKRLHTKHAYPGSGIGLSLCRKIAENHGGLITAESVEGEGATFTIILPDKACE